MLEKKVVIVLIGLFLITSFAYASPVYTEGISYQVEVLEDGQIQVRKATRVYKDGVEIGKTYHRHVLTPEADLTNEVKKVKDIAGVVWNEDVVKKFKEKKAERELIQ